MKTLTILSFLFALTVHLMASSSVSTAVAETGVTASPTGSILSIDHEGEDSDDIEWEGDHNEE